MKKILLIFTLLFLYFPHIIAGDRTEQQMRETATKVLGSNNVRRSANIGEIKEFLAMSKLRIYGYDNSGFAVVTSDDRYESVIGISSSQFTKNLPCGFKWWLETVNENMQKEIVTNSTKSKRRAPQNSNVAPMITTTWGQGRPYSDNCTYTYNGNTYQCVTGCVATALAQIMSYYRYPTTGTGSCSYDVTYNNEYTITYSEDFGQSTYDWDNMLDNYDAYYNTTTVDAHTQAVAKLMRDCGVALKMQYNVLESSANLIDAKLALINNFSYSSLTKYYYRGDYGKDDWLNIIYNELDNGRPILYGGALDDNGTDGHAFVLNGYDSSGNIYINWGWDGEFDGYFDIDLLNPGTHQFNNAQGMITVIPAFGMHTLSISTSGLGKVNYSSADGIMIRDKAKDFIVKDGNSVTLFFTPDEGRQLESVSVNGTDVTSNISNNQYTIFNISADISVVVSFESSTNADDVVINSTNFPDEAFQNWILNNIEAAKDGVLTSAELESIIYIDCSEKQIHSLKGIEYFTSLDNLYCQFNQLTSLDVSNNKALNSLVCFHNQLTALDVTHNTLLRALFCGENQLTSLDLSNNTELIDLACGYNQLTSLDVSNNKALNSLVCSHNQLTALDVTHNTLLRTLDCRENQLTSLNLDIITELNTLDCQYNQLSTLDVSKNTALIILNCGHNQLTSLDVSHNTALTALYASDNQLSTLDVSNNTLLTHLVVDFNQLTSLDVSHNSALESLSCWGNKLTSLDLRNNTALTYLVCIVNNLTNLDLSKNTALTYLRCELNQLYDLDLSNNKLLSSDTGYSPQYADITYDYINGLNVGFHYVSIKALNIPDGIAIPVPLTFDISKVSNLKLDETAVEGSISIINGLKFLVFANSGIDPNCKMLSYSYDTGNSTIGQMAVNVPITYTGTATIWTDLDTNHTWIYNMSDANASIDRNAWATGDILVPSAINGSTVNNIDYKAFYGCSGMTSLTIPSTVTHMCDYVINGCYGLEKLIVMATTPPAISDVTFMDYDIPLYVPDEAVDIYKNTPTWNNFKSIRALSTVNQHNLIYMVDGEVYKTYVLNEGEAITPEAEPTKEGYTFSGWSEIPSTMPDHDVTVIGSFNINVVTLDKFGAILEKGKTMMLKATVSPETLADQSVTWKSSNTAVATVTSSGKVKGVKAGTATITCTSVATGAKATCQVTVSYVKLDQSEAILEKGKTMTLMPTVYPSKSTDQSVTWKSSNTAVATVASDGTVKGVKAGTATITCTSVATGLSTTCQVTVSYVKLDKSEAIFEKGKTMKLTSTVYPSKSTDQSVKWKSSNTVVATVASDGTVAGVKAGTATITCTSVATGLSTTCQVTISYVKLDKTEVILEKGKTMTLSSTVYPSKSTDQSVTWKSSNTTVATVTGDGTVTGVKAGTATITCTSVATGLSTTCQVTISYVKLDKTEAILEKGKTMTLTSTVYPSKSADQSVKWKSSNTTVATVTSSGKVKGVKAGTATITCTSVATGLSTTCKVTVSYVKLDKSEATLEKGKTMTLTSTVYPSKSTDQSVTWKSSDKTVATVSSSGKVKGVKAGTATITCTSVATGLSTTCKVTVTASSNARSLDGDDTDVTAIEALDENPAVEEPFDVYDLRGRKVLHRVTSLDGLPTGVYIVNGKKVMKR